MAGQLPTHPVVGVIPAQRTQRDGRAARGSAPVEALRRNVWQLAALTMDRPDFPRRRTARDRLRLVNSTVDPARPHGQVRPPRWPWIAVAVNVLLMTANPGLAAALQGTPMLRSMVSLGGNPWMVQTFASISLMLLIGLAAVTEGYRLVSSSSRNLLALAGMLCVVSGAGSAAFLLLLPITLPMALAGAVS